MQTVTLKMPDWIIQKIDKYCMASHIDPREAILAVILNPNIVNRVPNGVPYVYRKNRYFKGNTKDIYIQIPNDQYNTLCKYARDKDMSVNSLAVQTLRRWKPQLKPEALNKRLKKLNDIDNAYRRLSTILRERS